MFRQGRREHERGRGHEDPDSETTLEPASFERGDARPTLEVVVGPQPGRRWVLERPVTVLGKGSSADLRFRVRGVSRAHAKIVLALDGIVNLVDLESTNGTFLNRARIDVGLVREGDRIQLGPHLVFSFDRRGPRPAHDNDGRLTPRQLEVARLVAVGSTNAEAARALELAPRTIAGHLERIYDQLGIGSRAELTLWLVEHGLHDEPAA